MPFHFYWKLDEAGDGFLTFMPDTYVSIDAWLCRCLLFGDLCRARFLHGGV